MAGICSCLLFRDDESWSEHEKDFFFCNNIFFVMKKKNMFMLIGDKNQKHILLGKHSLVQVKTGSVKESSGQRRGTGDRPGMNNGRMV